MQAQCWTCDVEIYTVIQIELSSVDGSRPTAEDTNLIGLRGRGMAHGSCVSSAWCSRAKNRSGPEQSCQGECHPVTAAGREDPDLPAYNLPAQSLAQAVLSFH